MSEKQIPEQWIEEYVEQLIKAAHTLGPETVMGQSALSRADVVMDMVKAWREKSVERAKLTPEQVTKIRAEVARDLDGLDDDVR